MLRTSGSQGGELRGEGIWRMVFSSGDSGGGPDSKGVYYVKGNIKQDSGTWESNLIELENYSVKSTCNKNEGKLAITYYNVQRRSKNFSFLKLTLKTGRKHQIRVHCKESGHPIVGDKRYGLFSCNPISRLCLHAFLLRFVHPFTGKKMNFTSPLPEAFSRLGDIPII